MDTVAPETTNGKRQDDPRRIEKKPTKSGKKQSSKGNMREPTQQTGAGGDQEELKVALQDLEEQKGDWSRGG